MNIKLLYDRRHQKRLTQKEISDLLGISQSYYSLIESGKNVPSKRIAALLTEILFNDNQ